MLMNKKFRHKHYKMFYKEVYNRGIKKKERKKKKENVRAISSANLSQRSIQGAIHQGIGSSLNYIKKKA